MMAYPPQAGVKYSELGQRGRAARCNSVRLVQNLLNLEELDGLQYCAELLWGNK